MEWGMGFGSGRARMVSRDPETAIDHAIYSFIKYSTEAQLVIQNYHAVPCQPSALFQLTAGGFRKMPKLLRAI